MKGVNNLDPIAFEHFARDYLVKNGYAEQAQVTQASHDWGADIRGKTMRDSSSFVAQVKHSRVGNSQGKPRNLPGEMALS